MSIRVTGSSSASRIVDAGSTVIDVTESSSDNWQPSPGFSYFWDIGALRIDLTHIGAAYCRYPHYRSVRQLLELCADRSGFALAKVNNASRQGHHGPIGG